MRRLATRYEEHKVADREIAESRKGVREDPFMFRLISTVYGPFTHAMIDVKHDGMADAGKAVDYETAQHNVTVILANMVTEYIRHTVSGTDLSAQFEMAQFMVAKVASLLQEDLNQRAADNVPPKPSEIN